MLAEDGEAVKSVRLAMLRTRHNTLAEIEMHLQPGSGIEDLRKFIAGWKASIRETMQQVEEKQ